MVCEAYQAISSLAGSEPDRERRYLDLIGLGADEPRYFVVWTAKTFLWAEHELGIEPIHGPVRGDVLPEMVAQFSDQRFFRLATKIGRQAYVFEVVAPTDEAFVREPDTGLSSSVLGATSPPAALSCP